MIDLTPSSEQRQILDLGLTTIRVRAGAGTGKTTTVAMVIANLIGTHGLEPEQVLGITFTNKAAAELADRVRAILGPGDPGRQVEVHTYHGFAAQVLSEFGTLAGVDNRAKVITPTFARQLLSETFHHRSYRHLDITWSRTLDKIRKLGDRLGDHLLTPAHLLATEPPVDDEIWAARLEMATTLAQYEDDKRRLRVVDYSDLVTMSTAVVSRHPELGRAIRNRYRVVVLDEYQDTNPAQRALLTHIFGDGFPVVAVGDEDQTIYEWRGASAENFELFGAHFASPDGSAARERGLTLNRRSTQDILDIANVVRRIANPDAEPLRAAEPGRPGEVVTYWAGDALDEADWIARTFERLHDNGVAWKDMAVLFRKNRDFGVVVEAMGRHDIPVEVANIGGLLSVPEVADLSAWLTIIEHPGDSTALLQVLMGSRYRLGMADLAPLAYRAVREVADQDDVDDPQPVTLIEAIEDAATLSVLRPEAREALADFHDIYRELLLESQGLSLVETCRMVLDRTRAWQDVEALPRNQRLTARLNLYRLLDLAEDWSPLRGRPSLQAFLEYLTAMKEEPADELDAARLSGEDAVTLVTVHRAKGLEWENVAIPALTKGNFPSKAQQYPDPSRFAEFVPSGMRIDTVLAELPEDPGPRMEFFRSQHHRQEWRVAYVAVTRAKRRLFASGAYWYGLEPNQKPREPSELWTMIDEMSFTKNAGRAVPIDRPEVLSGPGRLRAPDPIFEDGWETALRTAINDPASVDRIAADIGVSDEYTRSLDELQGRLFSLTAAGAVGEVTPDPVVSVTGLVTYARCPKRFYWSEVDPLPRKASRAATRGTEVHRLIELHQRGHVPLDLVDDDLYDVVSGGDDPGSGTDPYQNYMASKYAQQRADLVETPFTLELDSGHRLRGRIDAIYVDGGHWEVVDFKSGRPSQEPSAIVQLQAYGLAVDRIEFGGLPLPAEVDVSFAYLGEGLEVVSHRADGTWLEEARDSVETIAAQIGQGSFPESPGDWCRHCDFLRFCAPGRQWVGS